MDDLTVLDGDCEKIIKQGKLKTINVNNKSIILSSQFWLDHFRFKSNRLFFNCNMYTTFHCSNNDFCLSLQQVQTATLKRVCVIGMFIRDGF